MAKRKSPAGKRKPAAPRRPGRKGGMLREVDDVRLANHVGMVVDPCNSPIGPTAYRGKDGFITRFNGYQAVVGGATDTCGVIAYWPRHNRYYAFTLASPSTGFSIDFYNVTYSGAAPGGAFLGTNASEVRPIGACIASAYLGTELDRQGQVLAGVVPYKAISGTITVDWLAQLAQQSQRTPDHLVETKWIPSPSDEDYSAISATTPVVLGDDNIVFHAFRNFAATKLNVSTKLTSIFEWQPFYSLGLAMPSPNTVDPPAGLERVRSALARMGHWWLEAGETATQLALTAAQAYTGAGRVYRAATWAVGAARAVPMLTNGRA